MSGEVGSVSPVSLIATLCLGVLLLFLPRRYALLPLLVAACYMTLGQSLVIGGYHFHMTRILIAFGLIRITVRREIFTANLNAIDKIFIAVVSVDSFLFVLFSGETELVNERLGAAYNAFGVYTLVRVVIRNFDDILLTVKMLGVLMIPLSVPFIIEYMTGTNPFFVFGGVPEFTEIREGKLRCQGPFAHPILAGTFAATAFPLFVGLWSYGRDNRVLAASAILVATFIVVVSSSSGPLLAYVGSIVGLGCWHVRTRMRQIRWGIALMLLMLHMLMKAPVWFLMSRIADVTGGSGWYRSALIDAFVNHIHEWWLIGTSYTAHWMPTGIAINPKMTDIVNQYVSEGVKGGVLALGLFIWLIAKCFQSIGKAVRDEGRFSQPQRFFIWSLGCALFAHVLSFFSVAYFDQLAIFWYMIIGMSACLVEPLSKRRSVKALLRRKNMQLCSA